MELVEEERKALKNKSYAINTNILPDPALPPIASFSEVKDLDEDQYNRWLKTNVFEQKQKGFYGVYVRVELGNLSSDKARKFADIVDAHASNELRITVNQGYLLRFVRPEAFKHLYAELKTLGLADPGFDSVGYITACPGTDSCNLGISSSYGIALALEKVIKDEYPDLIYNTDIKIKISGCPNSCGQHGLASMGFHGSTIKDKSGKVMPALVVLLGGGKLKNGDGIISDKIIKIPSRRGPAALRLLLNDYEANGNTGEYYHDYFIRMGRNHFYTFLKPLGDITTVTQHDYIDWGEDHNFILHTAVGECAGVMIDLISTLLNDSEEKLESAKEALASKAYADSIYLSYSTFINTAKALLLSLDVRPSTQYQVINDFQTKFADAGLLGYSLNFKDLVFQINKHEPSEEFAKEFLVEASKFVDKALAIRNTKETAVVEK